MKIDYKNWEKNKIALSNDVFVNKEEGLVYKKYKQNQFNEIYGNQEPKILKYLNEFEIIDQGSNFIIMNYLDAKNFNSSMLQDEILLKQIAKKIKEIHNIDLKRVTDVGAPNFHETWEWMKTIPEIPTLEEEDYYAKEALKLLKKDIVLSNNDIVDGNILLFNGKIIIIDFEYGGLNNRMFDLASFLVKRQISVEIEKKFLKYYYEEEKFNRTEFLLIRKFMAYFWSKWSYYKFITTKEEIYLEIFKWLSRR